MAVAVLGAGKSGVAAAELLVSVGAHPLVSESGAVSSEAAERLQRLGVPFEEGGHSERVFDAKLCVVSPGIPRSAAVIGEMEAREISIVSEIELASWFCRARVIGITGTDGKTTTATLIHAICRQDGDERAYCAFSVGNIGTPFSSEVTSMEPDDIAVLELSSYQLEGCSSFRPDVAVLTNITPDHMDRYGGDIHAYAHAKFRIHASQGAADTVIFNHDDLLLRAHFENDGPYPFRLMHFGMKPELLEAGSDDCVSVADGWIVIRTEGRIERFMKVDEVMKPGFRGEHNLYNVLSAVAAARASGVSDKAVRHGLTQFGGVEHRQEFVGSFGGIDWINDSKATNVNALRQALQTVPAGMVLIAGGRDKGNDYASITDLVREKVTCILAIGESLQKIADAFQGIVRVEQAASLAEAVELARTSARPGGSVLFSPACSSFDMFANFEERGRRFKQLVREMAP